MVRALKLTPKQKAFCRELLVDLNATQAAIRAGYSRKTARSTASIYLAKPNIQEYVQELKGRRAARTDITSDRVLKEFAAIAFARITDIIEFDASGIEFVDSKKLEDDAKAAIASITHSNSESGGVRQSARMHDKVAALTKLGDHLGLFSSFDQVVSGLGKYGLQLRQTGATESGWEVIALDPSDSKKPKAGD